MKATVKRICGHRTEESLLGPSTARDRREAWLRTQPCPDCQRSQQTIQVQARAEDAGLPALLGTPKQVEWAQRLRDEKLGEMAALLEHPQAQAVADEYRRAVEAVATIQGQAVANWWIKRKDRSGRQLLAQQLGL